MEEREGESEAKLELSFLEAFANVLERGREGGRERETKIMSRTQKVIFTICLGSFGGEGETEGKWDNNADE